MRPYPITGIMRFILPGTAVLVIVSCSGGSNGTATSSPTSPPAATAISISNINISFSSITVNGHSFGAKPVPTPAYFNKFDTEATGQIPSDQLSNTQTNGYGLVKGNITHSGSKSLEWNYSVTSAIHSSDWQRNAVDLGTTGAERIYITAWVYLDKSTSTCTSWQWKGLPTITSSPDLYYDLPNNYPAAPPNSRAYNHTAVFTSNWYFDNIQWGNTAAGVYYYDLTSPSTQSGISGPNGLPSDVYLWNQWQRMEFYAQRSSSGGVADGIWREERIGRSPYIFNFTNAITHQTGNNNWRYIVLSHAVESVYNGYVNLNVYMDDVYIDNTQSRVEICDTPTWATRAHCEIQPATAWSDTAITATLNTGSFKNGDIVYFYVLDNNGRVNTNGYLYPLP